MILRRFMKHVTEQNWFAVGLDVLVVIFGVYIGVYLGEVAAERSIQHEVATAVGVIQTQLRSDQENLDGIAAYRREKLEAPRRGLLMLGGNDFNATAMSETLLDSFRRMFTFFPKNSGYSNLKDQGYLAKIDNAKLQQALANLYDRIYDRHTVVAEHSDQYAFDHHQVANQNWNFAEHAYIGDKNIARARLQNGFIRSLGVSEYYILFLSETVRPAVTETLAAIDEYQADIE